MQIRQATIENLPQYSKIPTSFLVRSTLEVSGDSPDTFTLIEHPEPEPWTKDYDTHNPPSTLPSRWDLTNWGIFLAVQDSAPIGGCILAHNTPGVNMLMGRTDLAVLWDIRVAPSHRGKGLGRCLFGAAVSWARSCRCSDLHVETQNINVPACRFYQKMGCTLLRVTRDVYPESPGEHQLIWHRSVSSR